MKKNIIIALLILLILYLLFLLSNYSGHIIQTPAKIVTPKTLFNLLDKKVALSAGVAFKNDTAVVIDSLTGNIIKPCRRDSDVKYTENNTQKIISSSQKKQGGRDCLTQIIPNSLISEAIESTPPSINGTAIVNGKKKNVKAIPFWVYTAEGSYCNSIHILGAQYDSCISEEQECTARLNAFKTYYESPLPYPFCISSPNCKKFYSECS